ncbi:MAG: tetratricopeptide repeat protein [Opitutus sp.]
MKTPPRFVSRLLSAFAGLLLTFTVAGCGPKGSAQLKLADSYFDSGQYEKAEIEYKNVLQAKGMDAHAVSQLGLIYIEQGRLRQSAPFLLKGRELEPNNVTVRNKLAVLYLSSGKQAEARVEAEYVLNHSPDDEDAPLILAESSLPDGSDIEVVRKRLKQLPHQQSAAVLTGLGMLDYRQKNYDAAEKSLLAAISTNSKFADAYTVLASLYLTRKQSDKAEQAIKNAAQYGPLRSGKTLQYAQYQIQAGKKDEGRRLLEDLAVKVPDYLPAQSMLAEIAAGEKRYDDSAALVAKILAKEPAHPEAALLSARLKLVRGDSAKAAEELERLLQQYPNSPQGLYFLGLAYSASGEKIKAVDRLTQAIKISPMPEAILALAGVNYKNGDYSAVILGLRPYLQKNPGNVQARAMLADAYRSQGNFEEALAIYRSSQNDFPTDPQMAFQAGLTLLRQKKITEAKAAFTESLKRSPGFLPALEQLVSLDVVEKRYDSAVERIGPVLDRDPKSPVPHLLLGRIYGEKGDISLAEKEFSKAIELRPDLPTPYFQLARLYITSNQQEKALANLKAVIDRNPSDSSALLLTALLQEQQKNLPAAREAYEKILSTNPKSSVALNNLAFLYSEHFNELDKAHELAQRARELMPDEPHAADTLGWILYKKHQYARSLPLLEDSAAGLANDPDVQYHLGMSRYMMGLAEPARQSLERALELKNDAAAADIRRRLAVLSIGPKDAGTRVIETLEKHIAESADDPIALARLGSAYEQSGQPKKAVATYQAASAANPSSAVPLVALARLYSAENDAAKAMEAAKAARKVAPDDPDVARSLGLVAHKVGDSTWAASLMQEAVRKQPDNAELLFEASQVVYATGRVEQARELAAQALARGASFSKGSEARQFLDLLDLATTPDVGASDRIAAVLKKDPNEPAALMALGAGQEQRSDRASARATYQKVLQRLPDFPPAKLRLAMLSAAESAIDNQALDWAQQARTFYPGSADAAKALGILTFRTGGDSTRVISLLKEVLSKNPNDAESTYYLGLAQIKTDNAVAGRTSLKRALELKLRSDLAADANTILNKK